MVTQPDFLYKYIWNTRKNGMCRDIVGDIYLFDGITKRLKQVQKSNPAGVIFYLHRN